MPPAETLECQPVGRFGQPARAGPQPRSDTGTLEAHAAMVRTGASSSIGAVSQTEVKPPPEEIAAERLDDEAHLRPDRRVVVIRPATRWPHLDLRELWHYRELMFRLVWRDVVVRYKQTFLGVTWAILVPGLTLVVYVIVFGKFAN